MDSPINTNSSPSSAASMSTSQNLDSSSFYLMTDSTYSNSSECKPSSGHGIKKQESHEPKDPYLSELKLFAREVLKKDYNVKMCEIEETVAELLAERDFLREANKKQRSKMSKAMSENEENVNMGHAFIDELNHLIGQLQKQAELSEELSANVKQKNSVIKVLRHDNNAFKKLVKKDNTELETLKAKISDVQSMLRQSHKSMEQLAQKQRSEEQLFRVQLRDEEKKRKALVSELEQVAEEISERTMFREEASCEIEQEFSDQTLSEESFSGSNLMANYGTVQVKRATQAQHRINAKVIMYRGRAKRVSVSRKKPTRPGNKNETYCI